MPGQSLESDVAVQNDTAERPGRDSLDAYI
jgi:hypothetical protein